MAATRPRLAHHVAVPLSVRQISKRLPCIRWAAATMQKTTRCRAECPHRSKTEARSADPERLESPDECGSLEAVMRLLVVIQPRAPSAPARRSLTGAKR